MKLTGIKNIGKFDKIVLVVNVLVAFAQLLTYISSIVSPAKFPLLAIWGLTFPFLLILNICFIIYWAIRRYQYAIVSFAVLLIGFKFIYASYHFPGSTQFQKPADGIRILSYNVSAFTKTDGATSTRADILNFLEKQSPDILCIQEYSVRTDDSVSATKMIEKRMGFANSYFKNYLTTMYDSTGLATFTHYPVVEHGDVPNAKTQAIFTDLKIKGTTLRIYNLHLQSTRFEAEQHQCIQDIIHLRKINWTEVAVIYNKIKDAFTKRALQAETIKKHMLACPYPYMVSGDFNDTPNSYVVNTLLSGLQNGFGKKGSGSGTTYYRDFPPLQIDYLMASPQLKFKNFSNITIRVSDHYPVMADMSLN